MESYSKVRIGKNLPYAFQIQNGLQQGEALSPLLYNFGLEYAIRKVPEIKEGLDLHGTHQFLVYADNANILDEKINAINKSTEILVDASREVGLAVNTEKTKVYVYVLSPNYRTILQFLSFLIVLFYLAVSRGFYL
jgi:hypothetical protein